jgi:hypothetical protein
MSSLRRVVYWLRWRHRRQIRYNAATRGDGHISYGRSVPMLGRACPTNPYCQGTCNRSGVCVYCGLAYVEGQAILRDDCPDLFEALRQP